MSNNKEYRYFKTEDFACQETNANRISSAFVTRLDNLRDLCGFPFIITSGYRDPSHSAEVNKPIGSKGQHTAGIAADIRVRNAEQRFLIVMRASRREGMKMKRFCWSESLAVDRFAPLTFVFHTANVFHLRYLLKKGIPLILLKRAYSRSH